MTHMSRKGFIAGGAGLAAASLVPARAVAPAQAAAATGTLKGLLPSERIGIQLYSVADAIAAQGFAKVLPELAEIGYKLVEFAGYTDATDITTKQLRALLDANGLKAIGSHVSPSDDESMKEILEDAATLGIPNVGISLPLPSQGPTAAGWKALSADYNRFGELAAKEGVGFYLHNHFHEWFPTPDAPGKRGEDILLAETDPRYVFFEMDIYWAHVGQSQSGGAFDPLNDYAIPFKDRYKLFHVKDGRKNAVTKDYNDAAVNIVDAGEGSIDFQGFFEGLFATGAGEVEKHHYVWERDNADEHPRGSVAAARSSYVYIRHGLKGKAAGGGSEPAANLPAAVTGLAFKGRTLRVTVEADTPVTVKLALKRNRRRLARRKAVELAAGRHVLTLPVPKGADAGRAKLVATFKAAGRVHKTRLPVRVPQR